VDAGGFDEPSTKAAVAFLGSWGEETPVIVVVQPDEETVAKSFRNIPRLLVLTPAELEVGALVWAKSVVMTETALARVQEVAA
jgi:ribosomal protein L4